MIIEITSSGGFAGIPSAGIDKKVVVDDMPKPMKEQLCEKFEPKELEKLTKSGGLESAADMLSYKITVTEDSGRKRVFELEESAIPAEMLDLIDEM